MSSHSVGPLNISLLGGNDGGYIGSNLVAARRGSRLNITVSNMPTQKGIHNTGRVAHAIGIGIGIGIFNDNVVNNYTRLGCEEKARMHLNGIGFVVLLQPFDTWTGQI